MNETCNRIIYLILDKEYAYPYAVMNTEIRDPQGRKFMDSAKEELKRLGIINIEYDSSGLEAYRIPQPVKNEIRNLPPKFSNIPYEYFLNKENNQSFVTQEMLDLQIQNLKKESQFKDLAIQDLVDKIVENPKVSGRLRRAEIISGISALAAIISTVVTIVALKGC